MASWVGPAIVAAIISALVTAAGWYVSESQASRREARTRRERVVDMQTALLAEIRANVSRAGDLSANESAVDARLREDPDYTPFVPRQIEPAIFSALISDLHLLPTPVIEPVVLYYQQLAAIAALAEDIRGDRFSTIDQTRKEDIYGDYIALIRQGDALAEIAASAISRSLSSPASVSSGPKSGLGPGAASAPDRASRADS